jgi:hypothetical protein
MRRLVVTLALVASACATAPAPNASLDGQLDQLEDLLVGDYFSSADGGAREGRAIYMRVRQIAPPGGHERALYAEMRHDGPDGEYYRQLVYLFDESADRTENRMLAHRFADASKASELINAPDLVATGGLALSPPIDAACYTVWTPIEAGFEGYLDPERCIITGRRGDQRRIEARTRITAESIDQFEAGYTLEGEQLFGNTDGRLYVWPRVAG